MRYNLSMLHLLYARNGDEKLSVVEFKSKGQSPTTESPKNVEKIIEPSSPI